MSLGYLRALVITDPLIIMWTMVMWSVSMLASFIDGTGRAQHLIAGTWSRGLLRIGGVRVAVDGVEKLDPSQSYVLVANHRSFMDTPVALGHIPLEFRFFAKHGLFHVPFIGYGPLFLFIFKFYIQSLELGFQIVFIIFLDVGHCLLRQSLCE